MSSVCSRVRVCSERSPIVYLLYIVFIIIMDNSDMEPNTQERLLQDREETTVQTDGVNEKSKPMQKIRKNQKKTKLTGPKATKQTPKAATNAVGEEDETLDPESENAGGGGRWHIRWSDDMRKDMVDIIMSSELLKRGLLLENMGQATTLYYETVSVALKKRMEEYEVIRP